jgi:hypothetical protein
MPEEKHSVHSSQFRPAAQEEIAAAKASGWKVGLFHFHYAISTFYNYCVYLRIFGDSDLAQDNPEEGKTFQASYNPAEVKYVSSHVLMFCFQPRARVRRS